MHFGWYLQLEVGRRTEVKPGGAGREMRLCDDRRNLVPVADYFTSCTLTVPQQPPVASTTGKLVA